MTDQKTKTRGRPARPISNPSIVVNAIIKFLQLLMTETLAKRVVGLVLIAAGIPNARIVEATGMSERSIYTLKSSLHRGNIDELFVVGHGSGRPGKAKGLESAIVEELEKNNYHTRQQIADMILEKFGVSMSVSAVGRLLKKRR